MTTTIIGNYSIVIEKVDVTSNKMAEEVSGLAIGGGLLSFMMIIILLILRMCAVGIPEFEKPLMDFVLFMLAVCIICLVALFFAIIFGKSGCGVRVSLDHGSTRITSTDHAFTSNPYEDAKKIQKIIDGYTKRANNLMAEETKKDDEKLSKMSEEQAEREKCCNQYKTVMKIVEEKQP